MFETIYTIPINETFEAGTEENECFCPICRLKANIENKEVDFITGDAMMQPSIRIETNEKGFCRHHFDMFLEGGKSRLALALMLESHLAELYEKTFKKGLFLSGQKKMKKIEDANHSCYVCEKIDYHFTRILSNAVHMWQKDDEFRKKLRAQKYFCLEHYKTLCELAASSLSKKEAAAFYDDITAVCDRYFNSLRDDISHFCRKFDYRYEDEPWGNSKDSVERAINFLRGSNNKPTSERK